MAMTEHGPYSEASGDGPFYNLNPKPISVNVEPRHLDTVLDLLYAALRPRVEFGEDVQAMRIEAEAERVKHIKGAIDVIQNEVPGLRIRNERGEIGQ